MKTAPRTFQDRPAVREKTPLLVGVVGPSGTGKTFSALRIATGIQRVAGGEIFVVDTEARRALHYAEKFRFRHVEFAAPFSPLDYLAAIEHCVREGARTIVVDSMSHEHEGPGGVLEMHEAELDRLAGGDYKARERMTFLAWGKPKAMRRRFINSLLQLNCNFVFCFRAKDKIKPVRGGEPLHLGWQPIAGEEFIYEMTVKLVLLPGANGTPSWTSEFSGEKAMMKLPEQFLATFEQRRQLDEDIGEQLARWAAGGSAGATSGASPPQARLTVDDLVARYEACSDAAGMKALKDLRGTIWKTLSDAEADRVKAAAYAAQERIDAAEAEKKAS